MPIKKTVATLLKMILKIAAKVLNPKSMRLKEIIEKMKDFQIKNLK